MTSKFDSLIGYIQQERGADEKVRRYDIDNSGDFDEIEQYYAIEDGVKKVVTITREQGRLALIILNADSVSQLDGELTVAFQPSGIWPYEKDFTVKVKKSAFNKLNDFQGFISYVILKRGRKGKESLTIQNQYNKVDIADQEAIDGILKVILDDLPEKCEREHWIVRATGYQLLNFINSFGEADASRIDPDGSIKAAFEQRGLVYDPETTRNVIPGTEVIGTLSEGITRFLYQLEASFSSRVLGIDPELLRQPFNDVDFEKPNKRVVRIALGGSDSLVYALEDARKIANEHDCIVGFILNGTVHTVTPDEK